MRGACSTARRVERGSTRARNFSTTGKTTRDRPKPTSTASDTRLGMIGTRRRLTSAEQQERDWYERLEHEERERGIAA